MIFVEICVGSSCHLKGSAKIVEKFQKHIADANLDNEIILSGSFCLGRCNREGVTISIGDGTVSEIYTGITPEGFNTFWNEQILARLNGGT